MRYVIRLAGVAAIIYVLGMLAGTWTLDPLKQAVTAAIFSLTKAFGG